MRTTLLLLAAAGSTTMVPSLRTHATRARTPMMLGHRDNAEFLNDPFEFINKNPQLFSDDIQEMAAYQKAVNRQSLDDWGELPVALDKIAQAMNVLQDKSFTSDQIARIITKADKAELENMVRDARFEEKRTFFQNLANLPPDNNGMLAINAVATSMMQQGQLPLIFQFEEDLKSLTSKVNELNDELLRFNEQYSTLFLSVRKASKLASIATSVSKPQ